jgi:hypothetical protein
MDQKEEPKIIVWIIVQLSTEAAIQKTSTLGFGFVPQFLDVCGENALNIKRKDQMVKMLPIWLTHRLV